MSTGLPEERRRIKKQQKEYAASKEQEIDQIIEKACKRYSGKRHVGDWIDATPEEKIEALDFYIFDLREIIEELDLRYGPNLDP